MEVGDKRKDTFEALGAYKRRFFSSKIRTEFIPPTLKSGNIMEICKVKDRKLQKRLKAGDTDYHPQEIENRLDIVKMEADPENDIDEVFRKNNIPCWRWVTLRMLASYDINLFESCTMDNKWLEGVVNVLLMLRCCLCVAYVLLMCCLCVSSVLLMCCERVANVLLTYY